MVQWLKLRILDHENPDLNHVLSCQTLGKFSLNIAPVQSVVRMIGIIPLISVSLAPVPVALEGCEI